MSVVVVLAADSSWEIAVKACVASLRRWHPSIDVAIITDSVSTFQDVSCHLLPAPDYVCTRPAAAHVVAPACMWRLAAPRLLGGWDFALYLDSDVVVAAPLDRLLSMRPRLLAARRLACPVMRSRKWRVRDASGMRLESRCFNAGVMLLNLEACRRLPLEELARGGSNDQSIFNAAAGESWEELGEEWNWTAPPERFYLPRGVCIVHFQGPRKPWACPQHAWRAWWLEQSDDAGERLGEAGAPEGPREADAGHAAAPRAAPGSADG